MLPCGLRCPSGAVRRVVADLTTKQGTFRCSRHCRSILKGPNTVFWCCPALCCAGVLLFQLSSDTEPVSEDTRVMEVFISGDACISIYTHLCPSDNTRPMALDLLWQVGTRPDLTFGSGDGGAEMPHAVEPMCPANLR